MTGPDPVGLPVVPVSAHRGSFLRDPLASLFNAVRRIMQIHPVMIASRYRTAMADILFCRTRSDAETDEGVKGRTITFRAFEPCFLPRMSPLFAPCSRIVERFAALSVFVNLLVKSNWRICLVDQLSGNARFNGGKMDSL